MRTRIHKSVKLGLIAVAVIGLAVSFTLQEKTVHAYSASAPDPSYTNAPAFTGISAEGNCRVCHSTYALNSGGGTLELLDLPTSYVPGQEYTIRVAVSQTGRSKFGFQLTALDSTGKKAGTFANIDATRTAIQPGTVDSTTREYISHAAAPTGTNTTATNKSEWTLKWTAPASRIGKITFYASGNAASNSAAAALDYIYTTSAVVTPSVATVSSADYNAANPVPVGGAASAFGVDLANTTASAVGTPTTTLGGTTVKVKDSLGTTRDALIFFVTPTQVNFNIADATAAGTATVTINSGSGAVSTGTFTIAAVQPGVFSLTGDGAGLPVAQLQRVNTQTNAQTFEDTFVLNGAAFNSKPIVFNANERLFLVVYANGVRNRSGLSAVSASIGGTSIAAVYAGPQGFFTGVDQVNVELPTNLGSGNKTLTLTVDGKTTNSTTLNFQ